MAETKSIGLDVDGVAAKFNEGIEDALGIKFTAAQARHWDVLKHLTKEQHDEIIEVLRGPEFWRNLKVMDGAQETVDHLNKLGYDISWITSPWERCETWWAARRQWLIDHFDILKNKHHYIPTSSKHKVAGLTFFVDDKPKNVEMYKKHNPDSTVMLFDQPGNRDFHWPMRVSWEKLRAKL